MTTDVNGAASTVDPSQTGNAAIQDGSLLADNKTVNQGDANAAAKDVKDDKAKSETAPEKYEDFKLPEGFELDTEAADEFKATAKELGLTQDKAQKLVDIQTKVMSRFSEKVQKQWSDTQEEWRKTAMSDKEFGGPNINASLAKAKAALDKYGTPELAKFLEVTGAGNNAEVIRLLVRVGATIKEDTVMTKGNEADTPKDPAKILFPSMA